MKIRDILFFIVNFIAIYSLKLPKEKTSQTTALVSDEILQNYDKSCPHLSNIIRENNLTNYTVNCNPLNIKNNVINEENVLEYACLIVKNILNFMCVKKLNITSDFLKPQNFSSFCPFNFSHLEKLSFTFNNTEIINELKNRDHCSKVCSDLYTSKTQCVVLSNFNNYVKNINLVPIQEDSTTVGISKPVAKSEHPEVIKQNTENDVSTLEDKMRLTQKNDLKENTENDVSILEDKMQLTQKNYLKEVTKEEKIVTKSISTKSNAKELVNEEKKTEKTVSSTPEKELKSNTKVEVPESEKKNLDYDDNFMLENNESKQKNDDLNEGDIVSEDDLSSIAESIPKTDFSQETKLPKVETPDFRMDPSFKNKEIYSGEGFFQAEDSHFFFYFIMVSSIVVIGYLAFHNKNKILAYALEGANSRRNRRRPNPARYRKLETNLEEVISSNSTNAASSSVVY